MGGLNPTTVMVVLLLGLWLLLGCDNFCFLSFTLFLLYHVVFSSCGWLWSPAITLSQPSYSYGCFVVGVVVVVGL